MQHQQSVPELKAKRLNIIFYKNDKFDIDISFMYLWWQGHFIVVRTEVSVLTEISRQLQLVEQCVRCPFQKLIK